MRASRTLCRGYLCINERYLYNYLDCKLTGFLEAYMLKKLEARDPTRYGAKAQAFAMSDGVLKCPF